MNKRRLLLGTLSVLSCLLLAGCAGEVTTKDEEQVATSSQVGDEVHLEGNLKEDMSQVVGDEKVYLNDLDPPEGIDYRIGDTYFVRDTDLLYEHLDKYIGKTLQYEGMVKHLEEGRMAIIRLYDMGHEDHMHEIFVGLDAEYEAEWPADETWVRVTGVIEEGVVEGGGEPYPILKVLTLEEIPEGLKKVQD